MIPKIVDCTTHVSNLKLAFSQRPLFSNCQTKPGNSEAD